MGHCESLFKLLRMDPGMFQFILQGIEPTICKKDTNYRRAISPGERLAVTLRYLATGIPYNLFLDVLAWNDVTFILVNGI